MLSKDVLGMEIVQVFFGVVLDHANLFQHDPFFLAQFLGIESGMMKNVRQQIDPLSNVLVQHGRIESRAFPGREGIEFSSKRIDLAGNGFCTAPARSFKNHVLDKM